MHVSVPSEFLLGLTARVAGVEAGVRTLAEGQTLLTGILERMVRVEERNRHADGAVDEVRRRLEQHEKDFEVRIKLLEHQMPEKHIEQHSAMPSLRQTNSWILAGGFSLVGFIILYALAHAFGVSL